MHSRTNPRGFLAALLLASPAALAGVSPAEVAFTASPGDTVEIEKTVTLPESTPKLDLLLLVDLSGSYGNDLPNIKSLADDLAYDIQADIPDSRFALATFVDFPFAPWGDTAYGDYAYQLDQGFTSDVDTWVTAVQGMTIHYGYDEPESQYEGLYQAVTGEGREMPITLDGDYLDTGEIEPGLNAAFRPDATRVIAITTDASFHEGGDTGYLFDYPGATADETFDALQAEGIKIVAIKAPGSGSEMDDLASATGGSAVTTSNTSAEIATAVLAGLDALTYTVSALPSAECDPLELSYAPFLFEDVGGGESVVFTESVYVPLDIASSDLDDGFLTCTVDFLADDTVIGVQTLTVEVPLGVPPVAMCEDLFLDADGSCLAWGDVDAGSYDPDGGPVTLSTSPAAPWGVGITMVTLTVTDEDGETDSCDALVTVSDVTPPTVVLADTLGLWPPNHQYWDLSLYDCVASVTDSCDGALDVGSVAWIDSVYSDEPEDVRGNGDGNTLDDILILDDVSFSLRAERQGAGNGRVYGISFTVDDGAGNATEALCTVEVPHSQNGDAAVDDGAAAGYQVY